jgi:hypothetical protein
MIPSGISLIMHDWSSGTTNPSTLPPTLGPVASPISEPSLINSYLLPTMQKDGFNGALKKLESPDNSTLYKNDTYHNETHEEKLAHLKPIRLLQQKLYAEQKGYDPKNQTKKQNSSRLYQDRKRH